MEVRDLDSLRQKPDFKHIVRAVLKHQMKYLVEQLSRYGEEEVMVLATSLQGGVVSHLGSPATDGFLENREDIKSQFLGHCRRQSFIERPESAVHRSENSSLQDVQTAIPQTHQYITAGSTLTCAVQPGIAVDSSPTFTSTLSSIGTQSVDMNMHPNTVNTQPNSNLHYPQSLSWQTTQVAPHNQSKAPMTGVTRTVKPTKSGVKRPCETVTSDKCSSIKTVRVCSSDIRDKNTALPTFIECTTEHTDAKKLDDDKSVEHLENTTEMQAVNDDSIFDDYVLGQFDGVEKSTDAPDTSNDQVSDDSSQIHQLTSEDTEQVLTGPLSRKSYNFSYKFEVMQYAEINGIPNAAKVYNLPDSTLRQWIKQKEKLRSIGENDMSMLRNRRNRKGRWPQLEERLENILHEKVLSGMNVTNRVIQQDAKNVAEQLGFEDFNASNGWVEKFKKRKCFKKNKSETEENSKQFEGPVA